MARQDSAPDGVPLERALELLHGWYLYLLLRRTPREEEYRDAAGPETWGALEAALASGDLPREVERLRVAVAPHLPREDARTLLAAPIWAPPDAPMGEADSARLDEALAMLRATLAGMGCPLEPKAPRKPTARKPELTEREQEAFDIIAASDKPVPVKVLAAKMGVHQSALTSRIIPKLKPHGVRRARGGGYTTKPVL